MPFPSIPLRQLGSNGPYVTALGLGLMGMSGAYGTPPDDEERFALLDRAFEIGARNWDSSDIYGDNEELLNEWFKRTGKREQIFLASKFGLVMDGMQFKGIDSSAAYCKAACEKSLKRLGVDYIDLYYAHRVNPGTPIEETMRALAELKAEGKIRNIGLCEVSSATLRRAHAISPVSAMQIEYSPFVREIEGDEGSNLLATCRELGITLICSSPLGRGLLTGTLTTTKSVSSEGDYRGGQFPWFSEENIESNIKLVNQFKAVAEEKGCSSSQLALAWLLKQGKDVIPIPGTKRIKYLEENWGALKVELSDRDEKELRDFVEAAELQGYRSVAVAKQFAYVDTKADN